MIRSFELIKDFPDFWKTIWKSCKKEWKNLYPFWFTIRLIPLTLFIIFIAIIILMIDIFEWAWNFCDTK